MRISNIGIIELEGMEFKAYHGCLEHEQVVGNLFVVDFKGWLDMSKALESDELKDALDYGTLYDCIAREMGIRSNLLEHLAGRIVKAISAEFPELIKFEIRVSKKRPPVNDVVQWSRITLKHE